MAIPRWDDPKLKAGSKIKAALWLVTEIGVGNTFTKEKLRQAFPGVAQIDRRIRELRDHGWVISTRAEDVVLNHDEQRLVAIGWPVWERGSQTANLGATVSAKLRRKTFADNDYQCVTCGIAGGETYAEAPHIRAVLSLSRRQVSLPDGGDKKMPVSECLRCRAGAEAPSQIDLSKLLLDIEALEDTDRVVFRRWIDSGRRGLLDRLWGEFRRLPPTAQDEIRKQLLKNPML